ncbi:MAG: hypothetical protein IJJ98_06870 [Prevotella sp.]|nr:hypothetical protein [Prevotella sp.]
MRKYFIIALLAVCATAMAQEKRIYFFADFQKTTIHYKNGAKNVANANYDVANRKVMFMQGEQLMELLAPETIDTLYMGGSRWVYKNKQFCEVIDREDGNRLLVGWHITKVHEGYEGALGSISQAPSRKVQLSDQFGMGTIAGISGGMYNGSFGVNQNDGNGRNFDVWRTKNQSTYYFTKDGREYGVKGMKSVLKAFPTKKAQIKQYVHDNNIDTLTAEGMLQVIDYLMTL